MPKTATELEKIIMEDGWVFIRQTGSHRHYKHPVKPGLITIPFHSGDVSRGVEISVLKNAGLK